MNPDPAVSSPGWTPVEHAAFWGIVSQFAIYFLGLGPVAPIVTAWPLIVLAGLAILRRRVLPHWLAILWLVSMIGVLGQMLAVFWLTGIGGWYVPGWLLTFALAAFLPMVGEIVRREVVFSASALLGVQALAYSAIAAMTLGAGLNPSYHSPIPHTRMTDPAAHVVRFTQPPEVAGSEKRLIAFTPFPTSGGAAACLFALLTLGYRRSWTKGLAMAGWLALILLTRARTAIIGAMLGIALFYLLMLPRRYLLLGAGSGLVVLMAFTGPLLHGAQSGYELLRAQRSASSQDRANIRGLAWDGWRYGNHSVMGYGVSVRGGPIVRDVGIGTHDFVAANLFIRGALGFGLTLLPWAVTLVFGFFAGFSPTERIVTSISLVFLLYTYSQELQTLYVHTWPVFLIVGAMGLRDRAAGAVPAVVKI